MRNTQMKSLLHIPYFMVGFITHQRGLKSKNLKGQSLMESHLMEQVLRLNQAIHGNENFLRTPEFPPALNILFTNSGPRTVDKSSRVRA